MVEISIIGTGLPGSSLALALKQHPDANLRVRGFDPVHDQGRRAIQAGAFEQLAWNLGRAVDDADLVVLALPQEQLQPTLAQIAPMLKPGCVVTAMATLTAPLLAWAAGNLAEERYLVAGRPALSPAVLHTGDTGPEAARADLFAGSVWALVPGGELDPAALKLVSDLARLAGATPFFVDAAEHDTLMLSLEVLPALLAGTLVNAATASPDWHDGRKVAGRNFATFSAAAAMLSPETLAHIAATERETLLAMLRDLRGALDRQIAAVDGGRGDALTREQAQAVDTRARWLLARSDNDWAAEESLDINVQSSGDRIAQAIGGKLFSESLRRAGEDPGEKTTRP